MSARYETFETVDGRVDKILVGFDAPDSPALTAHTLDDYIDDYIHGSDQALQPAPPDADAKQLHHCAIAVTDWLAGGCDIHDIPRTEMAVLAVFCKEVAADVMTKGFSHGTN